MYTREKARRRSRGPLILTRQPFPARLPSRSGGARGHQRFLFAPRGYQQQDAHEFMRYLLDHCTWNSMAVSTGFPAQQFCRRICSNCLLLHMLGPPVLWLRFALDSSTEGKGPVDLGHCPSASTKLHTAGSENFSLYLMLVLHAQGD
ncbi:hypothetical protein Cadr_000005141 [Camelus dromedarius]|uniref:Uncharacterized protein n=1 Tax=Camelus dromedarius TaxID=9838 RepID=A0A5N4E2D1_CAMDR|nr:hypothetical protein Cadr_000005141 [Camelus dromedarius]